MIATRPGVAVRHRAVLAHQAGDTARARSALQQSYAVATMIGDRRLTAETLNTLGGLELETRNLSAAEAALLEAESLATEEPEILARVEQNLGIVANIRGQHDDAEKHYRKSLSAYEALGAHFNATDVHRVIALCDWADGHLGQAETRLKQARELAKMTGARLTAAETARDLGRLYAQTGRMKEAHGPLREAAQGSRASGRRQMPKRRDGSSGSWSWRARHDSTPAVIE